MSDTRAKMVLEALKLTYLKKFEEKLDPSLLVDCLRKELKAKKIEFLKSHLKLKDLNLNETLELKDLVEKEVYGKTINSKDLIGTKEINSSP